MKKMKSFVIVALSVLSFGCQREVYEGSDFSEKKSYSQIAMESIENSFLMDGIINSRAVNENKYPQFFEDIYIEDLNGNKVSFGDLPEDQKELFYTTWKSKTFEILVEKMSENESLAEMIDTENTAFNKTLDECERSLLPVTAKSFVSKYSKNIQKMTKIHDLSRGVRSGKQITKDCLVPSSVEKFRSNYKKGRVLVCTDTSSSSGSSFVGHSSLMARQDWNSAWDLDGMAMVAVTSYPKDQNAQWAGKTDGVQYEPLGIWAGNSEGSSRNVGIYNVRKQKWIWTFIFFHFEYEDAPDGDYYAAADYAIDQIGKGYNWNFMDKNNEDTFYCSSLVYKAWYRLSN